LTAAHQNTRARKSNTTNTMQHNATTHAWQRELGWGRKQRAGGQKRVRCVKRVREGPALPCRAGLPDSWCHQPCEIQMHELGKHKQAGDSPLRRCFSCTSTCSNTCFCTCLQHGRAAARRHSAAAEGSRAADRHQDTC
jgi:hypothetical protein